MIYFIRAGKTGPIKIGCSQTEFTANARLQTFQVGNHRRLSLIKIVDKINLFETKFHQKFKKDNIRGEWFKPADDLLKFIKNL